MRILPRQQQGRYLTCHRWLMLRFSRLFHMMLDSSGSTFEMMTGSLDQEADDVLVHGRSLQRQFNDWASHILSR